MNKLADVARIKKMKEKKSPKKNSLEGLKNSWDRPGLLKDIENLQRGDIDMFQKIKADLQMKHKDIAKGLPISSSAVSVWLTAKDTDGVPEKWIDRIKHIFLLEYCQLTGVPMVPVPDKPKPVNEGRTSRHAELLDYILRDIVSRKEAKALADNDYKTAWEASDQDRDLLVEKAQEIKNRLDQQGFSS